MAAAWTSGTWSGQKLLGTAPPENLLWALALRANGVACGASKSESGGGVNLLKGRCSGATSFTLTEARTGCTYSGTLSPGSPTTIRGTWSLAPVDFGGGGGALCAASTGSFVLQREEADDAVHISGLALGEASPASELREFFFPTNPITWSLSILLDRGQLFGAGFFVDSGDVPGSPELFYSLEGTVAHDGSSHLLTLTKRYDIDDGGISSVAYTGRLCAEAGADGTRRWVSRGTWDNPSGGSHGDFFAHLAQPLEDSSRINLILCSCCSRPIAEGDTRWTCQQCEATSEPWAACSDCRISDPAFAHEHYATLLPEVTCRALCASGTSCARLIDSAFATFATRPLLHAVGAPPLTYAQAAKQVHAIARALLALGLPPRSRVVLLGSASEALTLVTLAVARAGHVVVPIFTGLPSSAVEGLFAALSPEAVWAQEDCHHHLVPPAWRERLGVLCEGVRSARAAAAGAGAAAGAAAAEGSLPPPPPPPSPPPPPRTLWPCSSPVAPRGSQRPRCSVRPLPSPQRALPRCSPLFA